MRLAFFKAFGKNANLIDWLIGIFSFSKHSHVELVVSNNLLFSTDSTVGHSRYKQVKELNEEDWDIIEVPVTSKEWETITSTANTKLRIPYDNAGVLLSVFKYRKDVHRNKAYCSEIVTQVLQPVNRFSFLLDSWKSTPGTLYKQIHKYSKEQESR